MYGNGHRHAAARSVDVASDVPSTTRTESGVASRTSTRAVSRSHPTIAPAPGGQGIRAGFDESERSKVRRTQRLDWNIRQIFRSLDRKSTRLNSSHLVISYA